MTVAAAVEFGRVKYGVAPLVDKPGLRVGVCVDEVLPCIYIIVLGA